MDAELERGKIVVRLASAIEPEWLIDLAPDLIVEEDTVTWDAAAERVNARSRMTWGGLVLSESERGGGEREAAEAAHVLGKAASEAGWRAFDAEGALGRWLERVRFVASHDGSFTPPCDEDVTRTLVGLCSGLRSFRELRAASLLAAAQSSLVPPAVASRLRGLAPERIQLPGGRSLQVHYETGKAPWVESRLQDFFGMADTPRVVEGKVPLVVHLLAPNARAVQVTTDLAGFWDAPLPGHPQGARAQVSAPLVAGRPAKCSAAGAATPAPGEKVSSTAPRPADARRPRGRTPGDRTRRSGPVRSGRSPALLQVVGRDALHERPPLRARDRDEAVARLSLEPEVGRGRAEGDLRDVERLRLVRVHAVVAVSRPRLEVGPSRVASVDYPGASVYFGLNVFAM